MEEYVRDERGLVYFHRVHPKDGVEPPLEASYLRDVNGNVVRWTSAADVDGDGNREARTSQYDGFDRPLVETDEVGGQRVFEYDARGDIVMQTTLGSSGGETPLDRDGTKNVLLSRDVFEYDERGRRIRHVRKRFGPGLPAQTLGREDVFFHDGSGRVIRHVADLGTHSFEYDGAGQLRRRVFPNGDEETLNYDAAGRKVRQTIITRPLAAPFTGDGFGADIVDSRSTVFHHDVLGRPTISVGPDGSVRRQEYDSRNNITETTDQVALVVPADVLTHIEDLLPLLNETQLESLNRDGNRVIYEYDNLDRPIRVAYEMRVRGEGHEPIELTAPNNPDGIVEILYSWDETGCLETWRTDRGGVSTVLRDGFGWVESVTDPVNRFVVLSNGRSSLPAEITDRNGSVIRQHYDALGRLIRREIFPAIQPQFTIEGTTLQIFQWDGLGRMTLAYDDNGPAELDDDCFTMRTYDSLGNVLQDNQTGLTVTRGFDAAGRVSRILYPGGRQIEVTRLSNGKPDEIRDGAWTYSQDNYLGDKLLERRLGNEVEISYLRPPNGGDDGGTHFDASGNITRQIWRGLVFDEETEELQEADLLNFAYGYDRAGRRLFEQRRHPELPQGDAMQYDSLGRLRLFIPNLDDPVSPPVNPPDARAINIDGNHNAILLVFNFNNTLIDVDASDRWIEIGSTAIESDRNGNVIFDGNDAFFHDFAGRVVRVERGNGSIVRFSYDASDMEQPWIRRPVGRLARRSHGTDSFQIIYDDDRIIEERRTAGSGPSIRREAIHDEGGLPVAVIENRTDGTPRTLFLLHGAGGSVAGVTDESGDLIETIKYDVYGLPFFQNASGGISKSVTDNPFLFRSMPFDTEVRMHVVGARFLSPNYLRFGSAVQVPDFVPARGSVAPVSDRQLSVLETVAPAPEPPQLPVPSHLETTGRLMAPAPLDTNAFNFNLNNPMR
jgi:YD repeat-containing protein